MSAAPLARTNAANDGDRWPRQDLDVTDECSLTAVLAARGTRSVGNATPTTDLPGSRERQPSAEVQLDCDVSVGPQPFPRVDHHASQLPHLEAGVPPVPIRNCEKTAGPPPRRTITADSKMRGLVSTSTVAANEDAQVSLRGLKGRQRVQSPDCPVRNRANVDVQLFSRLDVCRAIPVTIATRAAAASRLRSLPCGSGTEVTTHPSPIKDTSLLFVVRSQYPLCQRQLSPICGLRAQSLGSTPG